MAADHTRRSSFRRSAGSQAMQAPSDPWAWTEMTRTSSFDAQRISYRLHVLPGRRLAVSMSYEDGQPVRSMPYRIGAAERAIAASIMSLPRRQEDGLFPFVGPDADGILSNLLGSLRVHAPDGSTAVFGDPVPAGAGWTADGDGNQRYVLLPESRASDARFLADAEGPWIVRGSEIARVETTIDRATAFRLHASGALPPERSADIAARIGGDAAPRAVKVERRAATPKATIVMERDGDVPVARIGASYDGVAVDPTATGGAARSYDPETGTLSVVERDQAAEAEILKDATLLGLVPTADPTVYRYSDDGSEADAAVFAESESPDGWSRTEGTGWNIRPVRMSQLQLNVAVGQAQDGPIGGVELALDVIGDGQAAEFIDPLAAIARSLPVDAEAHEIEALLERHVRGNDAVVTAGDGRFWIMPAVQFVAMITALRRILAAPRAPYEPLRADVYSISDLAVLSADVGLTAPESLMRLFRAMRAGEAKPIAWPESFTGDRDDRQLVAASWMRALFETGYGGVLADDVGFGKTIEIGLHLQSLRDDGLLGSGALIAAPNNAVDGWVGKLGEFFPDLPVALWHGRSRATPAEDAIVITSHDLIKRTDCPLGHRSWTVAVLDEAQDAKKPTSALAYVLSSIDAEQKIPTTASPIENSLDDLWTMVNIANCGMLGEIPAFRKALANPIQNEADVVAANRLNAIVAPFVMQRIDATRPKPEIETVEVELSTEQKLQYDLVVGLVRERFEARRERAERTGVGVNQLGMSVMLSLTRIRQLCCSPLLMPGGMSAPTTHYSASPKTRAMTDKAMAYASQGKRVIVFSSWTGHLDITAIAMRSMGLRCVQYDGRMSARDKRAALASFKAHDADVLLMTTKSGGRSLDINEADAVFMADPWWNPKVEKQAIGRATRRGQTKTIRVYRFLTASPVERTIMRIHERKDHLSELITPGRVVESCDGLTLEDIDGLLDTFAVVGEDLRMAA